MTELILYSNPGCHLCEEAESLLRASSRGGQLKIVEIEGDLELVYRYALRIPVLKREDTGTELDWPFDAVMLEEFLARGTGDEAS